MDYLFYCWLIVTAAVGFQWVRARRRFKAAGFLYQEDHDRRLPALVVLAAGWLLTSFGTGLVANVASVILLAYWLALAVPIPILQPSPVWMKDSRPKEREQYRMQIRHYLREFAAYNQVMPSEPQYDLPDLPSWKIDIFRDEYARVKEEFDSDHLHLHQAARLPSTQPWTAGIRAMFATLYQSARYLLERNDECHPRLLGFTFEVEARSNELCRYRRENLERYQRRVRWWLPSWERRLELAALRRALASTSADSSLDQHTAVAAAE